MGVLACIPWIAIAVQTGTPSMIGFEIIMLILELRMWWLWFDAAQPSLSDPNWKRS